MPGRNPLGTHNAGTFNKMSTHITDRQHLNETEPKNDAYGKVIKDKSNFHGIRIFTGSNRISIMSVSQYANYYNKLSGTHFAHSKGER